MLSPLESSSVMFLTICSLLFFFLFFLLSPLLSFFNKLNFPFTLIAKQARVRNRERLEERSRDRERLEERSRDAVSA